MAGMRLLILICGRDEVHFNVEIYCLLQPPPLPTEEVIFCEHFLWLGD